jgi:hypothetical protein
MLNFTVVLALYLIAGYAVAVMLRRWAAGRNVTMSTSEMIAMTVLSPLGLFIVGMIEVYSFTFKIMERH